MELGRRSLLANSTPRSFVRRERARQGGASRPLTAGRALNVDEVLPRAVPIATLGQRWPSSTARSSGCSSCPSCCSWAWGASSSWSTDVQKPLVPQRVRRRQSYARPRGRAGRGAAVASQTSLARADARQATCGRADSGLPLLRRPDARVPRRSLRRYPGGRDRRGALRAVRLLLLGTRGAPAAGALLLPASSAPGSPAPRPAAWDGSSLLAAGRAPSGEPVRGPARDRPTDLGPSTGGPASRDTHTCPLQLDPR